MAEITGYPLEWTIDQQDTGQYFVKVARGAASHSSDGLGEGTVSALFIADALYDSNPNDVIVIDEPELSLHPLYQRRIRSILSHFARDRQIIVATHSPYFIDWADLDSGGVIHRVHYRSDDGSVISTASRASIDGLVRFTTDLQNPHVLGVNASEVFFLEDRIVLAEGQEDVLVYQAMARELNIPLAGSFLGWGVGGADKMRPVVQLLHELGYARVVGLLDGNRASVADELSAEYPRYRFIPISAPDVRTKPERAALPAVEGLADHSGRVLPDHVLEVRQLFEAVNGYLVS